MWAVVAIITRNWFPWFYWLSLILLPIAAIVIEEVAWLKSHTGKRVLGICFALFVLHVIWALVRSQFYNAALPGTYWKDDHAYFMEAQAIATAWGAGNYPNIWLKGAPPYLGTLHVGYHRPLATLFLLFGKPSTLAGLLLNALALCWMPLLCALSAKYLFCGQQTSASERLRSDSWQFRFDKWGGAPLAAAILAALHPAQFYWASFLMKDAWTAFVFGAALTLVLGAVQRRSVLLGIAAFILLPYVITVRIYAGVSIIAGLLLLPGLRITAQKFLFGVFFSSIVLLLWLGYTERGDAIYSQIRDSFAALAPAGAATSLDMIKRIGAGIPRLFLGPYAWVVLPEPSPMYGMYPGMWYLYLIGYPLGFAGLYAAVRKNLHLCIIPITAFGLAAMLLLSAAFGGNASRQRYYLEYIILIFAAFGIRHPSRYWIIGICILEIAWIIGQLIALRY